MVARVMIRKLTPFDHVEDEDVRHLFSVLTDGADEVMPALTAGDMKRVMLEMYAATKDQETGRLRLLADKACLPCVHLNIEKWDDERCGRTFLGVRAFWVENWKLRSATLAVSTPRSCAARERPGHLF